ncbi:MFS transporter [Enterococcus sp. 669A]|uniref:MFS transporter n=1 Tax=Candidatus Enterococcus moelleringii TaxID=2815325 RepID=A0ABS3L656_9ENTE|nr:MFS transporter [Enterococcus sp. 669A]MBO1305060.1 MFS transporter [Enterococcus sp. 669A]
MSLKTRKMRCKKRLAAELFPAISITIIVVILLTTIWAVYQAQKDVKKTDVIELTENWMFFVENHSDQRVTGPNTRRIEFVDQNEALIMQQSLFQTFQQPELIVQANHQWVTILLDDQPLYQYKETADQDNPGLLFTRIRLPADYRRKTLRVITSSPYQYYTGLPARVFLGETAKVKSFFLLNAYPQLLLLFICLSVSIGGIVLLVKQENKKRAPLVLLCVFALLAGLQVLVSTVPLVWTLSPVTLSWLYSVSAQFIPLILTTYYWLRTSKYRKGYFPVIASQYTLLGFTIISLVTKQMPLPDVLQIVSGLNVFLTLYTSLVSLLEAADDNPFYIICAPGIVTGAIIHCFFYLQLFIGAANLIVNWPLIVFTGLAVLILGYHFWEIQVILKRQANEERMAVLCAACFEEKFAQLYTYFSRKIYAENQIRTLPIGLVLAQLQAHYQKAFADHQGNLKCEFSLQDPSQLLEQDYFHLLIQVCEKLLATKQSLGCDAVLTIRQEKNELIIESLLDSDIKLNEINPSNLNFYRQHLRTSVEDKKGHYQRSEHQLIIRLAY